MPGSVAYLLHRLELDFRLTAIDRLTRWPLSRSVEMRFAHLETDHSLEPMRFRAFSGVRDEFHLAAIAQNLVARSTRVRQQGCVA